MARRFLVRVRLDRALVPDQRGKPQRGRASLSYCNVPAYFFRDGAHTHSFSLVSLALGRRMCNVYIMWYEKNGGEEGSLVERDEKDRGLSQLVEVGGSSVDIAWMQAAAE